MVLLGRSVWEAWRRVVLGYFPEKSWRPFWVTGTGLSLKELQFVLLPHPSGLCRVWNDAGTISSARSTLKFASPELASAIPE